MKDITPRHLVFVDEAAKSFDENPRQETHRSEDNTLIALRMGMDRDCVMVYELGEYVGNFVQQVDKKVPQLRKEVNWFAHEMEKQLKANEHKPGWSHCPYEFLINELERNLHRIKHSSVAYSEFRRRCANIANFAMMLADNDRREEKRNHEN
jgi:hypothetical protein